MSVGEDRVLISETGSQGLERAKGAIWGFAMVLGAVAIVAAGDLLLVDTRYGWVAAAILIPLVSEGMSAVALLGRASVGVGQVRLDRWWRKKSIDLVDVISFSAHGDRVMLSTRNGTSYSLQWPWYIASETRRLRAIEFVRLLQEQQSSAGTHR